MYRKEIFRPVPFLAGQGLGSRGHREDDELENKKH